MLCACIHVFACMHMCVVCDDHYILQDCEDHTMLLCSLLLGFGLNAFVCIGCKKGGVAHTWIMTIAPDGSVTFWESLTGERLLS